MTQLDITTFIKSEYFRDKQIQALENESINV